MKEIGIIGYGRFGKLAASYLKKDFSIYVYDENKNPNRPSGRGIFNVFNTSNMSEGDATHPIVTSDGVFKTNKKLKNRGYGLEEVCSRDIVLLCVPISKIGQVLLKIKDKLHKGSIVIDVCSVKEYPISLMKKNLPNYVGILGTHPLFGPDSAAVSLQGKKIVVCPVRIKKKEFIKIVNYLKAKGLDVIITTPKKHDKEIAKTLGLVHFLGRAMVDMGLKDSKIDTEGFKQLLKIMKHVRNDSEELFFDMNKYNSHSKKMRKRLIETTKDLDERLSQW